MAKVMLHTTLGDITIELDEEKAPVSTKNFLEYVDAKHYDGTLFHRVINGFMIQGGGYDTECKKKPTRPPISNEADNGLKNERGSVAMARTSDVSSATSQFFINVVDNPFLDHREKTPEGYGYAVVGKVVEGMDIVDKIKEVPTGPKGSFTKDCPLTDVLIISAERQG
jgi:peptidyl-prolyl cis-trans isomerase B (cyclophilin B)